MPCSFVILSASLSRHRLQFWSWLCVKYTSFGMTAPSTPSNLLSCDLSKNLFIFYLPSVSQPQCNWVYAGNYWRASKKHVAKNMAEGVLIKKQLRQRLQPHNRGTAQCDVSRQAIFQKSFNVQYSTVLACISMYFLWNQHLCPHPLISSFNC